MCKFSSIVILALAVCVAADPIRQRSWDRRQSARQQLAPTSAPRGYAPAGITPEIPFELPTETEQPDVIFNDHITPQPDQVYGPPENGVEHSVEPEITELQPEEVYGPPEGVAQPDEIYGPATVFSNPDIIETIPEVEDIDEDDLDDVIIAEDGSVISVSSTFEQPARLIYQRFPQGRQAPKAVPARLIKSSKIIKPAKLIYTAKLQNYPRIR